jgi:hypothetical protein
VTTEVEVIDTPANADEVASVLVCVDITRTRKGYTLTLHRREGVFPVLAVGGREPRRWQNLDTAMDFLTRNFGVVTPIHLTLAE